MSVLKWLPLICFTLLMSQGMLWDAGTMQHPDERFIHMSLEAGFSREYFDSHFFVYGCLPLFLVQFLHDLFPGTPYFLLQRYFSCVGFWTTIIFASLTARRLGGSAYVTAWLCASNVLLIQHAHFGTVESGGVALVTMALSVSIQPNLLRIGWLRAGLFGCIAGLAAATKLPFGLVFIVYPLLLRSRSGWVSYLRALSIAGLSFCVVFRFAHPYGFTEGWNLNPKWIEWLKLQRQLAIPNVNYPPSVQWFDNPWWNSVYDMAWFGMGPGVFLLCVGTFLFGAFRRPLLPLVVLSASFLLIAFSAPNHFMRYALPTYPILFILAAQVRWRWLTALVILFAATWTVRFSAIYRHDHTRVQAARWVAEYLPPGRIAYETLWDDKLPISTEGDIDLDLFSGRRPNFQASDYIVITSRRVLGSAGRLYPETRKHYEQLFSGISGFKLIKTFSTGLNDESADESFQVYDHPDVFIFMRNDSRHTDSQ